MINQVELMIQEIRENAYVVGKGTENMKETIDLDILLKLIRKYQEVAK